MSKKKQELCMGCMKKRAKSPICPYCGFDVEDPIDLDYLPPETQLNERYTIGKLLHNNGESAKYIAYDNKKEKIVVVREYFPAKIAKRNETSLEVEVKSSHGAQYKALMAEFVDLFNDIKKHGVNQPLVKVVEIFNEKNTTYVVNEYLDALTFDEYLNANGGKLSPEDALEVLVPIFNCIDNIHLNNIIHRGISPYTVLISKDDKAYIDDFALPSVRTGGSELQSELFSGYSAPEQYLSTGWQGTWTDVYALAALLYRAVSGVTPIKSIRVNKDNPLTELSEIVPDIDHKISYAVKNAMNTVVEKRTQTSGVFLSEIYSESNGSKTEIFDSNRIGVSMPDQPTFEEYYDDDEIEPLKAKEEFFENFSYSDDDDLSQETISQPISDIYNEYNLNEANENKAEKFDFSYEAEEPTTTNKKAKMVVPILIVLALAVSIVLAVFLSNKLGLNNKDNAKTQTTDEQPTVQEQLTESPTTPDVEEKKEYTVPDLAGKKWSQVEFNKEYTEAYKIEKSEEFSKDHDEGVIVEVKPRAGTKMPKGSTIVVVVSKGYMEAEMPELVGKEEEEAMQELLKLAESMTINYEDIEIVIVSKYSNIVEAGKIISTKPIAGEKFNPLDDKVEIVVALSIPKSQSSGATTAPTQGTKPSTGTTTGTPPKRPTTGTNTGRNPGKADNSPNVDNLPRA